MQQTRDIFLCDAVSCHRQAQSLSNTKQWRNHGHDDSKHAPQSMIFADITRDYTRELLSELINEWCTTKDAFVIRPWNSFTSLEASSEFVRPLFLHTHS
jgi:hypothetical protein